MSQTGKQPSVVVGSLDLAGFEKLARSMVDRLAGGLVIGLVGTLGAGKTTLVQAIARAAGIDAADVTSPTFTLWQTYRGAITLHHLDAYRIADEDEFLELGVEELFDNVNEDENEKDAAVWTLLEWADRFADCLPAKTLWLNIDIDPSGTTRTVTFSTPDSQLASRVRTIAGDMGM